MQSSYLTWSKQIEDTHLIIEIQTQLELLFNISEYFLTFDIFKNTKETIQDIMENNIIELIPSLIIKQDSVYLINKNKKLRV
ncbi:unnamed protein product [Paramecium sonneborni]|uniref:Uncharacterized protein n=1 Tax=Paramecium sonneborni TaxID=65129 RepID=A0A8S1RWA2_9CILI|nr:unnamed protein product [Paramecium sonneborni]